jgi:hypothetical protein
MGPDKDEIGRRYRLNSRAELPGASERLPKRPGDMVQSSVDRHSPGHGIVWDDTLPAADGDESSGSTRPP